MECTIVPETSTLISRTLLLELIDDLLDLIGHPGYT